MARVQISLPEKFLFETEISVRVSDLNYGAHLAHDAVLTIMQEARVLFYRSLGFKDEISFEGNVGQILADAAIQYKAEGFLGDVLTVKIGVDEVTRVGFDMLYLIQNKHTGKEIARGKTGIVCFDYNSRKVAAIPISLLQKLRVGFT